MIQQKTSCAFLAVRKDPRSVYIGLDCEMKVQLLALAEYVGW